MLNIIRRHKYCNVTIFSYGPPAGNRLFHFFKGILKEMIRTLGLTLRRGAALRSATARNFGSSKAVLSDLQVDVGESAFSTHCKCSSLPYINSFSTRVLFAMFCTFYLYYRANFTKIHNFGQLLTSIPIPSFTAEIFCVLQYVKHHLM